MPDTVSELARSLAENAEAVCRHYLFNGRRQGRYWLVGDVHNTPGRSLYVRLSGKIAGPGAAGRWTDAATGEHGDLLDLIQAACGCETVGKALDEARRFLGLARGWPVPCPAPSGSPDAARRLFAMADPLMGTLAERYLANRGLGTRASPGRASVSSAMLVSARPRRSAPFTRCMAGTNRGNHRFRRHGRRRAAHLARSFRRQQGARDNAEARTGAGSRQRRTVRACR